MKGKRKRQVQRRGRAVEYLRSVDSYGRPFLVISHPGAAPTVKTIGVKENQR